MTMLYISVPVSVFMLVMMSRKLLDAKKAAEKIGMIHCCRPGGIIYSALWLIPIIILAKAMIGGGVQAAKADALAEDIGRNGSSAILEYSGMSGYIYYDEDFGEQYAQYLISALPKDADNYHMLQGFCLIFLSAFVPFLFSNICYFTREGTYYIAGNTGKYSVKALKGRLLFYREDSPFIPMLFSCEDTPENREKFADFLIN